MPKAVRFFFKILSIFAALGLLAFAGLFGGAAYLNSPPKPSGYDFSESEKDSAADGLRVDGESLYLEVRRGESADSVGKRLKNAGVIKSRYFWSLLFRIDNQYLKAGSYKITLPAAQTAIRSVLTAGEQILVKVTIPEGVTLKKTARILEDTGICQAEEFLSAAFSRETLDFYKIRGPSMEGYLYPDTYLFPLDYPASQVVRTMADTFYERIEELRGRLSIGESELNRRLIIASIVEREYRLSEEAALMAGVFYNRLEIGMALQSCATVEYVITEIEGRPHPEQLFNRDLEIRDPYNTYLRPGLPPGPISAPGITALNAAFYPASTDYLYFRLTDPNTGRHYFSRTLDDHIRAGALYVKGN
jgi:UPF0755 protein